MPFFLKKKYFRSTYCAQVSKEQVQWKGIDKPPHLGQGEQKAGQQPDEYRKLNWRN